MRIRYIAGAASAALFGLAVLANTAGAAPGYLNQGMNLRAGPGVDYPLVASLPPGTQADILGCLPGWTWCDIATQGLRGWMAGAGLEVLYDDQQEPLAGYGQVIGLPFIGFDFGNYWGDHYRGRPWYSQVDRWHGGGPRPEGFGGRGPGGGFDGHGPGGDFGRNRPGDGRFEGREGQGGPGGYPGAGRPGIGPGQGGFEGRGGGPAGFPGQGGGFAGHEHGGGGPGQGGPDPRMGGGQHPQPGGGGFQGGRNAEPSHGQPPQPQGGGGPGGHPEGRGGPDQHHPN